MLQLKRYGGVNAADMSLLSNGMRKFIPWLCKKIGVILKYELCNHVIVHQEVTMNCIVVNISNQEKENQMKLCIFTEPEKGLMLLTKRLIA